ncbi:uncharacterized protein VTP21DRAFT_3451 [Calcarisporiella thermophila]|uniref:uncharacterized protein n=1 Tax=Calcarisporiella thermophila TaxID=911321 RepID=UPI003743E557
MPPKLTLLFALAFFASSVVVDAHMEMTFPLPRRSQFSDYYKKKNNVDYDNTAPVGFKGTKYPCKHPKGPALTTLKAGQTINTKYTGPATHKGGHCQWALSYDGVNFAVIKDEMETCPTAKQYSVTIPESAPSGDAVFAWTWVNAEGNREYYMNCADVKIEGGPAAGGEVTGPELLVVNVPNHPKMEEFSQDKDHGRKAFRNRKTITITSTGVNEASGSGSSSGSPSLKKAKAESNENSDAVDKHAEDEDEDHGNVGGDNADGEEYEYEQEKHSAPSCQDVVCPMALACQESASGVRASNPKKEKVLMWTGILVTLWFDDESG